MTRKEELQTRADLLSRQLGSGHGGKPIILKALQQVEREVWGQIVQQIDYRHCTVTMDQTTLKEWCMKKYKEIG